VGGLGIYLMATAINLLAGSVVVNPTGLLILVLGSCLAAAVGIELSGDIAENKKA